MQLNAAGEMIQRWWSELNQRFLSAETDEFTIMPNHFHGIIIINDPIVGADLRVGPEPKAGAACKTGAHTGAPLQSPLGSVIRWFKTMTTNDYIRSVKIAAWPQFDGRLWQRNYYEHIIRNEESLNRIRQYILDNPARWAYDRENPAATNSEPKDAWLSD